MGAGWVQGETVHTPSPLKPYALQISLQAVLVVHRCILGAVAKGAVCSGKHLVGRLQQSSKGRGHQTAEDMQVREARPLACLDAWLGISEQQLPWQHYRQ